MLEYSHYRHLLRGEISVTEWTRFSRLKLTNDIACDIPCDIRMILSHVWCRTYVTGKGKSH